MSETSFFKKVLLFISGIVTGIVSFVFLSGKRGNISTAKREIKQAESDIDKSISGISDAQREQRAIRDEVGRISDIDKSERGIIEESSTIVRQNRDIIESIQRELDECKDIIADSTR